MEHVAALPPPSVHRLLAEVVRNLPLAAAVLDRELRYIAHNRSWFAAHGYRTERDVIGQHHYEVFPQIGEPWRQVHQRCLAGATESSELDVFEHTDGHKEYLRWTISPWRQEDNSIGGIVIYAENISAHVTTQQRLKARENLIRDLFERSPFGLNLCTMEGLWLESNPAFLEIIGYSKEEADGGLTYWQMTPRKYDADEAKQLELLKATRRYGPYEKEFIRKDGRLVPVRLNGFIVDHHGEACIWSLIEDLSAQRQLEAQVEQEQLKAIHASKLATLGEMAAGIAHEINNPLSIIAGNAFALREAIARGDTVEVEESLAAIEQTTVRTGKIVHGLRKFSRHGSLDPAAPLSLATLIQEAIDLCSARMRTLIVTMTIQNRASSKVMGHGIDLSQVLVNLLNNSIDSVRLAAQKWIRITVEDGPELGWVTLAVEDSGPLIPADIAERIFQAFFTTKLAGEGTGLGLSISRSIVERHGGTLAHDADASCNRFVVRLRAVPDPQLR